MFDKENKATKHQFTRRLVENIENKLLLRLESTSTHIAVNEDLIRNSKVHI